jgi:hypothetical protein
VQVHEAGERDEAVGVDHLCAGHGQAPAQFGNDAVTDHKIGWFTPEDPGAFYEVRHDFPPSSR